MQIIFETDEDTSDLEATVDQFVAALDPVEGNELLLFRDDCTGAIYVECHLAADTMLKQSTDDVALDPDQSSEYRANRQLVDDHAAFKQMKEKNRFTRLEDRMLLLQNKFKGSKLTERPWWEPLKQGTDRRNSIAHPRGPISMDQKQIEVDLSAVLTCASDLFEIVFGKRLPYESFGLKPKVNK